MLSDPVLYRYGVSFLIRIHRCLTTDESLTLNQSAADFSQMRSNSAS